MSKRHLDRIARVYGLRHDALSEALDESLDPRGPDMLLDTAGEYLRPGALILDIGCRNARYLIRLVHDHDCRGIGFDPVDRNVERAKAAVEEAGLGERIEVTEGTMERIEQPDEHFDLVWCRDVLVVVEGLEQGVLEAARVLKRDGVMLIYTTFATRLFEPGEAAMIHEPLGNVPANLDEGFVETAFERAGLVTHRKDVIGTEWREYEEEREQRVSHDLLRLARLRRRRDEIVERYGREAFELTQALLLWRPYVFLGKVQPVMYVLKPGDRTG